MLSHKLLTSESIFVQLQFLTLFYLSHFDFVNNKMNILSNMDK